MIALPAFFRICGPRQPRCMCGACMREGAPMPRVHAFAMVPPNFPSHFLAQSDFGRSGPSALWGAQASDLSKNRVVARRAARIPTWGSTKYQETDDAKGHRQVVKPDEG